MAESKFSEDMEPTFPNEKIDCNGCMFRKAGTLGYKNAYCEMYPRGKPNDILFKNAKCEYRQVYA